MNKLLKELIEREIMQLDWPADTMMRKYDEQIKDLNAQKKEIDKRIKALKAADKERTDRINELKSLLNGGDSDTKK